MSARGDFHYSRATPPSPPYSAWDMSVDLEGKLVPDFVPDVDRPWTYDLPMVWVAQPRVDARAPLSSRGLISSVFAGAFGVFFAIIGAFLGPAGPPIVIIGVLLIALGFFPTIIRRSSGGKREPSRGDSTLTLGRAHELAPLEAALRRAVSAAGLTVVTDQRRGWVGRGFEWRLSRSARLQLHLAGADEKPYIWVAARGIENRHALQELKGQILAACRGLELGETPPPTDA